MGYNIHIMKKFVTLQNDKILESVLKTYACGKGQNCQKPIHFYKGFQNPISLCFQESGCGLPQIRTQMFTTFQTREVRKVMRYCSHGHDVRSLNWHHLTSCLQQGSSLMRLAMIFFDIFWLPLEKVLLGCWMVAANAMSEGHGVVA